jgi:uncharacterized protein (TIGR03086 family)
MDLDAVRDRHRRAIAGFGRRVRAIDAAQWRAATPCAEWDVRQLVNHLVYEQRWTVPLLERLSIEQVGDRFDGDLLGDDPVGTWSTASEDALVVVAGDPLDGEVHLSYGDVPATDYVTELTVDAVVHTWDLARGIGDDERLEADLVELAIAYAQPRLDAMAASEMFDPPLPVPDGADPQTRMLALFGRHAGSS